ncbi:MAG: heavy metal-responsive transcriptional regulator [Acidobacteria bacterium]|nr:MAG: heavy metal-responsive transcriptional regulator [Acidobacteriota bacterium]
MGREAIFIGEVSRKTGLSIHTIRFYEAEGLLPEASRTESGYRLFSSQAVEQLQFIQKAQALGFALDEIRELLVLRDRDTDACSITKSLVEEKLANIRAKIEALAALEVELKGVLVDCGRQLRRHPRGGTGRCPVLARAARNE